MRQLGPDETCLPAMFCGTSVLGICLSPSSLGYPSNLLPFGFRDLAYARHLFAAEGGDLQGRVLDLVLEQLNWNGEGQALDIGCGNGALVVKLAANTQMPRLQELITGRKMGILKSFM